MRHMLFAQQVATYEVALLIKEAAFNEQDLRQHYIQPLNELGVSSEQIIGFTLSYNEAGKAPAGYVKQYLTHLMPSLDRLGVKYLYVADSTYFKVLAGVSKAEPHLGYVLPCKFKGCEHMQVVLGINYHALIYNPDTQPRLDLSVRTLAHALQGTYQALGQNIIRSAQYPQTLDEIASALNSLLLHPRLAADIEAFSLRFRDAGVATIAFAWDEHHGVAFPCDYIETSKLYTTPQTEPAFDTSLYGQFRPNTEVRKLLREFFERYEGTLIWHGSTYDLRVLIYTLWMAHPLDVPGLLKGLDVLTRKFEDTKAIAFLATNSTAGNDLKLKSLAHEFAGNWAQEAINDVRRIPLPELLQYNLVDTLCTCYVYNKYWDTMVHDEQLEFYERMIKPSLKVIIQMELIGMPMDIEQIGQARKQLETRQQDALSIVRAHPLVSQTEEILTDRAWEDDYEGRKAKAKHPDKIMPKDRATFPRVTFNPNSGQHLQVLLYELMGLPVIDYTPTRQPAVGADTLDKLINHATDPSHKEVLEALINYGKVTKILGTFIPAFEDGFEKADGRKYLHGNFNLPGTVSGRLTSSDPKIWASCQ